MEGCRTLQEAHTCMEQMRVAKVKEVIKPRAGKTILLCGEGFYAVANGEA
jgi:hypothetical protein